VCVKIQVDEARTEDAVCTEMSPALHRKIGARRRIVEAAVTSFTEAGKATGGLLTSMDAMLAAAAGDTVKTEEKIKQAAELGKDYVHFHHTE